jgi:hypothetical protein
MGCGAFQCIDADLSLAGSTYFRYRRAAADGATPGERQVNAQRRPNLGKLFVFRHLSADSITPAHDRLVQHAG